MVESIVLNNLDTKATLSLAMIGTSDFVLESVDWGQIESVHRSYKYVNQIGVSVTGTSMETREVEITGWVIASTDSLMSYRKSILNRFFNPQQPVDLVYKGYRLRFLPDMSVAYSVAYEENNNVMCRFKVVGIAPDPLFSGVERKVSAANTIGAFHFPFIISELPTPPGGVVFGKRQPSLIVNIVNEGYMQTGMRIVFRAAGTLTNPSLVDINTQQFMRINKQMVAGEVVEINTNVGEKGVQGKLDGITSNYVKYKDFDSTWLVLKSGDNFFRYDADDGIDNLEVYVYFSNRYLEVQECY